MASSGTSLLRWCRCWPWGWGWQRPGAVLGLSRRCGRGRGKRCQRSMPPLACMGLMTMAAAGIFARFAPDGPAGWGFSGGIDGAEDAARCAGDAGQVAGQAVHATLRQPGERRRLHLRGAGHAALTTPPPSRAAALPGAASGGLCAPPPQTISNLLSRFHSFSACCTSASGQFGQGRLHICRVRCRWRGGAAAAAIAGGEQVAPGALGGGSVRNGSAWSCSSAGSTSPAGGPCAVVVIGRLQVLLAPVVHQGVAGAAVEAWHRAVRAQYAQAMMLPKQTSGPAGQTGPSGMPAPAARPGCPLPRRGCGSRPRW